jgi:hypothetical protein
MDVVGATDPYFSNDVVSSENWNTPCNRKLIQACEMHVAQLTLVATHFFFFFLPPFIINISFFSFFFGRLHIFTPFLSASLQLPHSLFAAVVFELSTSFLA